MNHHFRSYSESTTSTSTTTTTNTNTNNNNSNSTNGAMVGGFRQQQPSMMTTIADIPEGSSNGIIRIHSDSQQSLDRLFNPLASEATNVVPLRQRNLPSSFFSPRGSQQTISEMANEDQNQLVQQRQQPIVGNLHSRSTSFDYRPKQQNQVLATNGAESQLRQAQNSDYQQPTAALTTAYLEPQPQQPVQQQQIGHHYRNFSMPAFMDEQVVQSQPSSRPPIQQPQQQQNTSESIDATQPIVDRQHQEYQHYQLALPNQGVTTATTNATTATTAQQQQYISQNSSKANQQQPQSPNYHQQFHQRTNYHQPTYTQPQIQQQPQPQQLAQQQQQQPLQRQYDNYCHPQLMTQVSEW